MTNFNKTDFAVIIEVKGANPNGDPLNENRPRTTLEGLGEITDVCIKRKLRNRLQDIGEDIFVQTDGRQDDGITSLRERYDKLGLKINKKATLKDKEEVIKAVSDKWFDVRAFGQLFAFKGSEMSLGIRGAVTIQQVYSIDPINIVETQITKSVNSEKTDGKASDTMGTKYYVDYGVYVVYGSISSKLAERTGLNKEDVEKIKEVLVSLFENDASSARPEGSMNVINVYWWEHANRLGNASSGKVHKSLKIRKKDDVQTAKSIEDYEISVEEVDGVTLEILEGY